MIAMSLISTCDEYRRDRIAGAPVYPVPAHPFRRAMMHALGMIGVGGVATADDDEAPGVG